MTSLLWSLMGFGFGVAYILSIFNEQTNYFFFISCLLCCVISKLDIILDKLEEKNNFYQHTSSTSDYLSCVIVFHKSGFEKETYFLCEQCTNKKLGKYWTNKFFHKFGLYWTSEEL
jgi:hypothetical protein